MNGLRFRDHRPIRRGFTLLEAMMATGILVGAVFAVTTAITAGQQQSLEARKHIAASLVAEELLGRMIATDYNLLNQFNNFAEIPGQLTGLDGELLPSSFDGLRRTATVTSATMSIEQPWIVINGKELTVRVEDERDRTLIEITRFVPEPQA